MLLSIDIGNTNIILGIFDGQILSKNCCLATLRNRTSNELPVFVC